MRSSSRTLGSVLLLQAVWLASVAVGAPVLLNETTPASSLSTESTTEFGRAAPAPVSPLSGAATTPAEVPQSATPSSRLPNPVSTMASDAAGSQRYDGGRNTAVGNARAKVTNPAPATNGERGIEIELDPELKEAAKAALQWAREAKHWVDPAGSGADAGTFQQPESTDGPVFEKGGGGSGPVGITPSTRGPGTDPPYARSAIAEVDLIREAIKFIREVAWHPVTWLLMPLVALGSAAVWVVQHRAQTERRQMIGLAARGQRGSPDSNRSRLKRRSSRTVGTPPAELMAGGTPLRPRRRRSAKPQRLD